MSKTPQQRQKGRPELWESAERFLMLMAAARMSKPRLSRLSGIKTVTLTSYENAKRQPADAFEPNSKTVRIARAMNMLHSALMAWWAAADDGLLSVKLKDEMDLFSSRPLKEKLEIWKALGWQQEKGRQPGKKKAAPPRAEE